MKTITGQGVFAGVAIGPIHFYTRHALSVPHNHIPSPEAEIKRAEKARDQAVTQLEALRQEAEEKVGQKEAALFEIHQMMLQDPDFWDSVTGFIHDEKANAEWAVEKTAQDFSAMFAAMDDPYMQGRAADVTDISQRMLSILLGGGSTGINPDVPSILAAEDLVPSETLRLDKSKVLAIATAAGSANSHASILARTMGIPAIVGMGPQLAAQLDGTMAIVDGGAGTLIINPNTATLTQMQAAQAQHQQQMQLLQQLKGQPNTTLDGTHIDVYANIGGPQDVAAALENDAGGIGLFRSEFLFIDADDFPDEETQFAAYKEVLQGMNGLRVIIRTLDIGADKKAPYFQLPAEENPALGMRAVRICLTRPEVFRTQLRAIYRASAFGKAAIMFPMIASLWELQACKEAAQKVRQELKAEGTPFDENVELGIMIETPAAAILSDILAPEADFFSIGTNDLTQYTLVADRQNQSIARFADPHHPAVLRLIESVVKNAHAAGIWAGICGELGADLSLTETFLHMGVDELSVAPASILPLRQRIRGLNLSGGREPAK